ncbi:hypothetical protein [Blastococcus sp. SYSU D00813]
MRRDYVLRVASLGLGLPANVLFLAVASNVLDRSDFGLLALLISMATFCAALDLGVSSLYTTTVVRADEILAPWASWVRLSLTSCSAVTVCVFGGAAAVVPGLRSDAQTLVCVAGLAGSAVLAGVGNMVLGRRIAAGRLAEYYVCFLVQPLLLLGATGITWGVGGDLPTFVLCFSVATLGPAALTLMWRPQPHPIAAGGVARRPLRAMLGDSLRVGIRQLTNYCAYTALPILAGVVVAPTLSADLVLPLRFSNAVWTVVGVPYNQSWSRTARDVATGDTARIRSRARSLTLTGLAIAGVGASATVIAGPLCARLLDYTPTVPVVLAFALTALALVLRAAWLGLAQLSMVTGMGTGISLVELATVLAIIAGLSALTTVTGDGLWLLLVPLCCAALGGLISRWNVAQLLRALSLKTVM